MKIGMCMLLWTTNVTDDHAELLADIKAAGFDGVEIPIFEGRPEDFARLGRRLDELGLERTAASAISVPGNNLISADPATRAAGIGQLRWASECAQALGAATLIGPLHSTIGIFSGDGPTADELRWSLEAQREIGDYAARCGVTIALEALNRFECYLFNTMAALATHVRDIGHPNIRAMYDTFHANIEEQAPAQALAEAIDVVHHIHISENDRGVPGRGNIDWAATFDAIVKTGYDNWLTIESFGRALPDLAAATKVWRDFAESPDAVYREGIAHIRNMLDRHRAPATS